MNKIYFLCTGNSCRSQMAEGYARIFLKDKYEIQSAGLEAHGVNPLAIEVMAEDNIDISHQYSKTIDPHYFKTANLIVTLCGDAKDRCPVIAPSTHSIYWPLPDPAQATGTPEQQLQIFRQVRNEIKQRILALASNP
ncbi:arsenate reductase (thioredoxin) [Limosilactobacillus reuteri]|uniref:arsenate reductase (thioredoxin) n=1 Tax=Limosilactobacillus reuteri TaxID=1598 RepID=UPI00129A7244|nr:arsenate reductase (thioredoxin) [Limosilactobacillus reuteri]MCT3207985.1 arsenate reductase (thioredoxin) [Limosilactobacillus reuteri]MCT3217797.1 arsenate reductase (thioredoxin) [Limosilactobacillus reuteri]MRG63330.1 arsenate reductase (thioredoxin) [Limosilactobacillus reuteri]MRH32044.1 arsenate reductase (thioredoxin) [Limosilactobacillus reuteri]